MSSVVDVIEDAPKTSRRGILGWMFFDWAAQPFFTVVTTFIFGPYFVARLTSDPVAAQTDWSNAATIASFIIAILSPVLGAVADETGAKKRWIGFFAVIKIVFADDAMVCSPRLAHHLSDDFLDIWRRFPQNFPSFSMIP